MHPQSDTDPPVTLSRREVLLRAMAGVSLAAVPFSTAASEPAAEEGFVPKNDYPFFGYEPKGSDSNHLA